MRSALLGLLLCAAACNKPGAGSASAPQPPPGKAPAWGTTPANAPAAPGVQPGSQPAGQPTSQPRAPAADPHAGAGPGTGEILKGSVEETIQAGPYTYLRLSQGAGQAAMWAAVPTTTIPVGTGVAVLVSTVMTDFYSNTLKRGFPVVIFGTLAGGRLPDGGAVTANPRSPH